VLFRSFIDKNDLAVIPFKYDFAAGFTEGNISKDFSMVGIDGKYGFIDKTGKEVVPIKYTTEKAIQKLKKLR
jgi:hypothetical protein